MRFSSVGAAAALTLVTLATSLSAQRTDEPIDPRSLALVEQGRAARAAGDSVRATDLFESALAVDPRNRGAFIQLAGIAQAQKLPGKAIRLYREALSLEPDDVAALAGQGEALVQRGAVPRARDNLAKIKTLCRGDCAPAQTLAAAIAKGPPPVQAAQVVPPTTPPNP